MKDSAIISWGRTDIPHVYHQTWNMTNPSLPAFPEDLEFVTANFSSAKELLVFEVRDDSVYRHTNAGIHVALIQSTKPWTVMKLFERALWTDNLEEVTWKSINFPRCVTITCKNIAEQFIIDRCTLTFLDMGKETHVTKAGDRLISVDKNHVFGVYCNVSIKLSRY